MSVLVDTSIWSLAIRRRRADLSHTEAAMVDQFRRLLIASEAQLIGPIRQEVLTGIRDRSTFEGLRDDLRQYLDEPLHTEDFELAAEVSNRCRSAGVSGSSVDFLMCAVASRRGWDIFTTDRDFARYAKHVQVRVRGIDNVN